MPVPNWSVIRAKLIPWGRSGASSALRICGLFSGQMASQQPALEDDLYRVEGRFVYRGRRTICIRVCLQAYRNCRVMNAPLGAGFWCWTFTPVLLGHTGLRESVHSFEVEQKSGTHDSPAAERQNRKARGVSPGWAGEKNQVGTAPQLQLLRDAGWQ